MRRPVYSIYSLAGLLVALGSLGALLLFQPATAQIPNGNLIVYNQTFRNEIRSSSGAEHRFTGCRDEVVNISATSSDFSPRIYLYRADDAEPLASASTSSRTALLANVSLPDSGLYTLVVVGRSRNDRGDYALTLNGTGAGGAELSDIPNALNLTLGQVVTGTLPVARVDQWLFRGCDGDAIHVHMNSDRFAPKVSLYAPSAEHSIAGAEGMSAEFQRTLPESGVYVLSVAGTDRTDTGSYTLSLTLESTATPSNTAAVMSEVTPTATSTRTPTPAAGPRVRRGTPRAEALPTRRATAQATATAKTTTTVTPTATTSSEMIMPGMGEGAFRLVDLNRVGGPVNHVVYAPDGDSFASAGVDGAVRIWHSLSGALLNTLAGHDGPVHYLAYSPDGELLASAGNDGTVRLWNPQGMEITQLNMAGTGVNGDGVNGDGINGDGVNSTRVHSVAFSPDSAELVATSEDGDVFVWDVAKASIRLALLGHEAPVYHATFSPDGKYIATGDAAGFVRIWDVSSGALRQTLPVNRGPDSGDPILSVVFSPDSSTLVVGGVNGVNPASVQIWDLATGEPLNEFVGHDEWGSRALISPDGAYILSMGLTDPNQDGPSPTTVTSSVRLWDTSNGALRIVLLGLPASVVAATFRPGGDELLVSDGTTVYIWPSAMVRVLAAAFAQPVGVQMPVPAAVAIASDPAQPRATPAPSSTPAPTRTVIPTSVPMRTPTPTQTPTSTPTITPIEILTPTYLPFVADVETYCTVTAQNLNLRSGPGTAFDPPLTLLANGALLMLTGRNADSSWLQVDVLNDDLEPEITGWISANFVFCTGEINEAPVIEVE